MGSGGETPRACCRRQVEALGIVLRVGCGHKHWRHSSPSPFTSLHPTLSAYQGSPPHLPQAPPLLPCTVHRSLADPQTPVHRDRPPAARHSPRPGHQSLPPPLGWALGLGAPPSARSRSSAVAEFPLDNPYGAAAAIGGGGGAGGGLALGAPGTWRRTGSTWRRAGSCRCVLWAVACGCLVEPSCERAGRSGLVMG